MKTLSSDTSLKVEQLHIELIRKAPVFRRLELVSSLVKTTRKLSWQAIRQRYPDDTPEVRIKRFIYLLYGDKRLAEQLADLVIKKAIR